MANYEVFNVRNLLLFVFILIINYLTQAIELNGFGIYFC